VNVEPRFSPDGRRIAFVSTLYNGRFHIFTADFNDGALANVERLTGEHKSDLPRYYYSPYDHEINPVWTRDGRSIIYVSNRDGGSQIYRRWMDSGQTAKLTNLTAEPAGIATRSNITGRAPPVTVTKSTMLVV